MTKCKIASQAHNVWLSSWNDGLAENEEGMPIDIGYQSDLSVHRPVLFGTAIPGVFLACYNFVYICDIPVCSCQQFSVAVPYYSVSGSSSSPGTGGGGEVEYVLGYDKVKELQQYVFSVQ